MNAKSYLIVTPELIRRANRRCVGRMLLFASGALAVFLVLFLFAWILIGFFTPNRPLTLAIFLRALAIALSFFYLGWRYLRRNGPQNWERIAQKSETRGGMRIASRGDFHYVQMGEAVLGMVLAGPDWLRRVREEFGNLISATPEKAKVLESLRQNLAAREGWVPLRHFEAHQKEIEELVALGLVSIREMMSEWHLHVTLQGTVSRSETI
ncbi:hypothetical protein N9A94_02430 [Akkermansiaceae bacterium]|nr:hypothetical protein [Akkermansiaceae bacterium]